MSKHYIELLKHILDECKFIQSTITPEKSKNEFIENELLKRAVIRSLEIIGEATKQIPTDIKYQWKEIHWRNMAGMRDKLIHDYFGINYTIVWDVVKNKIPDLTRQIEKVLKELE
jgi:uncharacterized protein with HEPN domain